MRINIHTHSKSKIQNEIAIFNQYPLELDKQVRYYSIGIHPWYIKEQTIEEELLILQQNISSEGFLAIGECGLDKYSSVDLVLQEQVLIKQLQLAQRYNKAVILHLVSHYDTIIRLKKEYNITVPLIIHGFRKSKELALSLQKSGFYLSFGCAIIQQESVAKVFQAIDKDYVFLETDDNKEYSIDQVYNKAICLHADIEVTIEKNFKRVFKNII
ncbi:TatD family hydrolase [Myroides sp. LJL115]